MDTKTNFLQTGDFHCYGCHKTFASDSGHLFCQNGASFCTKECGEWFKNTKKFLDRYIAEKVISLLSSERQKLKEKIDWILTPHDYESDNPEMEGFALKLKVKYKKKILKLLEE